MNRIAFRVDMNPKDPTLCVYKDYGFGYSVSTLYPIKTNIKEPRVRHIKIKGSKKKIYVGRVFNQNLNVATNLFSLIQKYAPVLSYKEPTGGSTASLIEVSADKVEMALNEIRQFFVSNKIPVHVH